MVIEINVKNKIASRVTDTAIVCGNSDYKLHFTFDEEWNEYEVKTARFYYNGKKEEKPFRGNECEVPVLEKVDGVFVGVFAGDLHTTTPAYIPCVKSILCLGGKVKEPSPDVYAQIMQMINDGMVKGDKGDPFEYEDFTEEQLADLKDGLNTTVAYGNYQTMITAFNSLPKTAYTVGQNVMIVTLNVPDLWIASIEETAVEYEYISDEAFVETLKNNGTVQVGNYVFAALETQKVDLAEYVKNTDYATNAGKAGPLKLNPNGGAYSGLHVNKEGELVLMGTAYAGRLSDVFFANPQNYGVPVLSSDLYRWIKVGLVQNTETWTDEDKAKACETIGAVGKNEITALMEGKFVIATFDLLKGGLTKITLQNLTGMTKIDWGDGTVNNELTHTYAERAEYECKIYGVTSIGSSAFHQFDSLTSVTIGNGVTSIGSSAFHSCRSLTSVEIPDSVTEIGDSAFQNCESLTSVVIGDGVTSIGNFVFAYCDSLTSMPIGNNVTSIGQYTFSDCNSLTEIVIPDRVTSIGWRAFYNCTMLTSVEFKSITPIKHPTFVFSGTHFETIYVPYGTSEDYKTKWTENGVTEDVLQLIVEVESDRVAMMSDIKKLYEKLGL